MTELYIYTYFNYNVGFRDNFIDANILAVISHLNNEGYSPGVLNYKDDFLIEKFIVTNSINNAVFIVHIGYTDTFGNISLKNFLNQIREIKKTTKNIKFIFWGYLAYSIGDELFKLGICDVLISNNEILYLNRRTSKDIIILKLAKIIKKSLIAYTSVTNLNIQKYFPFLNRETLVCLYTSRGCNRSCTFCAYNLDLNSNWIQSDLEGLVRDISYLYNEYGIKNIAFCDSDFGGDKKSVILRSRDLEKFIKKYNLTQKINISLNIRIDLISKEVLNNLFLSGVHTVLTGIESFTEKTLRIFRKPVFKIDDLYKNTEYAEQLGINIVASYILWHPWQEIKTLKNEMERIIDYGRFRIPQFLSKSKLQVIPNTPIEGILKQNKLLIKGFLERDFKFIAPDVRKLHNIMQEWYRKNVSNFLNSNSDLKKDLIFIAELKIAELNYFYQIIKSY
jgi:radical SAM superfamily enzyme YgiQ (UPF0313 family)